MLVLATGMLGAAVVVGVMLVGALGTAGVVVAGVGEGAGAEKARMTLRISMKAIARRTMRFIFMGKISRKQSAQVMPEHAYIVSTSPRTGFVLPLRPSVCRLHPF